MFAGKIAIQVGSGSVMVKAPVCRSIPRLPFRSLGNFVHSTLPVSFGRDIKSRWSNCCVISRLGCLEYNYLRLEKKRRKEDTLSAIPKKAFRRKIYSTCVYINIFQAVMFGLKLAATVSVGYRRQRGIAILDNV